MRRWWLVGVGNGARWESPGRWVKAGRKTWMKPAGTGKMLRSLVVDGGHGAGRETKVESRRRRRRKGEQVWEEEQDDGNESAGNGAGHDSTNLVS
nr:uncharacterized protein CTRU02_07044 [Colletotrichum truncatum]KAF6791860.1 hypothetical protein CTRU02_07044 [Colletotrichum truncatum]